MYLIRMFALDESITFKSVKSGVILVTAYFIHHVAGYASVDRLHHVANDIWSHIFEFRFS